MSYIFAHNVRVPSAPFGDRRNNLMTLERAIDRPNSVLAKTVRFLERVGYATREEICRQALGFKSDVYRNGTVTPVARSVRGWNSNEFALMVNTGFIQKKRWGRQWVYTLGYPADYVKR